MATPSEALAHGRRLIRVAAWMLGAALVSLVGLSATGYIAATAGWIAEDDATMAVVGLTVGVGFLVAAFVTSRRGARLIRDSIAIVAEQDGSDIPDAACFGYRRPMRLMALAVPPYAAALVSLPFWTPPATWVCPVVTGSVGLACLVGFGPEAAGFTGACVDASGIRLPAAGLHPPGLPTSWTSARSLPLRRSILSFKSGNPCASCAPDETSTRACTPDPSPLRLRRKIPKPRRIDDAHARTDPDASADAQAW